MKKSPSTTPGKKIRAIDKEHSTDSSDSEDFFIGAVKTESPTSTAEPNHATTGSQLSLPPDASHQPDWIITLESNGTHVDYKLDTGAQANVLPYCQYKRLHNRPALHKTKTKLSAYNNEPIKVEGSCIVTLVHKSVKHPTLFIVADTKSTPIIGLQTCSRLNLVKRINEMNISPSFLDEYADCFGELGTIKKPYHIVLDPSVPPVIDACRKVPIALQDRLRQELLRMEDMKVIKPVTEPTDWVSSVVTTEKPNGSLRVCLDPRNLNKAIRRHHHKLPTTEEILSRMSGAKYFSKLDVSNAYWQVPLDEESSHLLTFNTPIGRYRYLRMPYGIHSASEICQAHIAEIIEKVPGTANCQDDIIIWSSTPEELADRTRKCLDAIRKSGLKLRKHKCQFGMSSITFLGHSISDQGIKPDTKKISAILNMPTPTNVKELQRFLGMVTYLGKFIPNLSKATAPLRKLLEKDIMWNLDKPQMDAINNLKQLVTSSPTLQFYDPNLPIRISCDASQEGLGAVLEQQHNEKWSPVAYASRTLTSAESNYCPLERETLAIVFSCERFHEYVYGRHFIVLSDHLPLKSIFNKPLSKSPARLQRFRLRLQRYDFTVQYQQGKLMYVADTLSRAPLADSTPEIPSSELNTYVHSIMDNLPISQNRIDQFQKETEADPVLIKLKQQIQKGWPTTSSSVHQSITPFFSYRDELSLHDGLIVKGQRIVVPTVMRKEMINILHIGHPGIQQIKERARESLFWPGINSQLEQAVTSCESCQQYRNRQPKEPQLHHAIPETPWTKLATDVFHFKRKHFVILVDYTTKYFDVSQIPDVQSETVTNHTKAMLSRYGIPKEIVSDGGPEYIGHEYKSFCKSWDIEHTFSSPEYHESNGFAERTIQTVKRTLKKCLKRKEDPQLALLALKCSKVTTLGTSPSTLFFNRTLRTLVPSIKTPEKQHQNRKQEKPETSTNPTQGKPLEPLQPGDSVRFHDGSSWSRRAKVISNTKEPRSYLIRTDKHTTLRRNRRHLLKTTEHFDDLSDSSDAESLIHDENPNVLQQSSDSDATVRYEGGSDTEPEPEPASRLPTTRSGRTVNRPKHFQDYK